MRLTELSIRVLKEGVYRDDAGPRGFGIRIGKTRKTFFLMIGANRTVITLGHWPSMTLAEARKKARYSVEPSSSISFKDALDQYIEKQVIPNQKPSSAKETTRILRLLPFGSTPLSKITTAEIRALIDDKSGTPAAANNTFSTLRAFLRWAHERELISNLPVFGRRPFKTESRDRVLSTAELIQIFDASDQCAQDYSSILMLLTFLGQRKGEIYNLEWSFLSEDTITWPARLVKNNTEHTIPIGPGMRKFINTFPRIGNRIFGTFHWGDQKDILDRYALLPPWRHHDLRRTWATNSAKLGTLPHITERILNHRTVETPISRVYNKHTYMPEMKAAMVAMEYFLAGALT